MVCVASTCRQLNEVLNLDSLNLYHAWDADRLENDSLVASLLASLGTVGLR